MKILVVDDDEVALLIAKKVLQTDGHEVFLAGNGKEALDSVANNQISLIISDWNMPIINGVELCRRIRDNSGFGYIYFIMVTSRTSKEDLIEGLSAGVNDFISKPFEPVELLLRIRNSEKILSMETTSLTLFSLAKLAESKDTDTGQHLERIREYSRALAEELMKDKDLRLKVHPKFAEMLYETSPLHDIGKVGIPDTVLLKPASLSDEEWAVMKNHTTIGSDTLGEVVNKYPNAEFMQIAKEIAWSHHERWDGKGYPRGLSAEEIPLAARIVAVADVYDALTMKRVYKSAIPHDIARGIIVTESNSHFDPRIVEAFLAIEKRFIEIKSRFLDQ
jgi:putative two-component system response regulator